MTDVKEAAPRKSRVFLADDSQELRDSLRKLLESEPDFVVCGEADTVQGAVDGISSSAPDVAIVDIGMGPQSGFHVLRVLGTNSHIPILIFSMHPDALYADAAFEVGAQGYLMKSEPDKITTALRQILNGKLYDPRKTKTSRTINKGGRTS